MSSAGLIAPNIGAWVKLTLTYEDFADPSLSFIRTLAVLNAKKIIKGIIVHHTQAFGGGGIASYLLNIGITGDESLFVNSVNVFAAPSSTGFSYNDMSFLGSMSDDINLRVQAIATGANLDQATTGSVDIYILTGNIPN